MTEHPPVTTSGDRSAPESSETHRQREAAASRKAGRFWGGLIVGLLAAQLLIGGFAIVLATGNPSAAIVPDYYEKALNWDQEMAARAESRALGWAVEISAGASADRLGDRTVVVSLTDGEGAAIEDASVTARLYHHARASAPQTVDFAHRGGGRYVARPRMVRSGLWQVEATVTRGSGEAGAERFVADETVDVSGSAATRRVEGTR